MASQTPNPEKVVTTAANRAADRAEEPIAAAEEAVQNANEKVEEVGKNTDKQLDTFADKVRKIVQEESEKAAQRSGLSIDRIKGVVEDAVNSRMEQLHVAHDGGNPSEPVQAAVASTGDVGGSEGASDAAAREAVDAAVPPVPGRVEVPEPATPDETAASPPPPVDDVRPKPEHWSRRKIWGKS